MEESMLTELYARTRVTDVIQRYASTIDTKQFPALRQLFTDKARAVYNGDTELVGGDAIVEWIKGATATKTWQHHLVSVYHPEVHGSEAHALVYLISHQTDEAVPNDVLRMVSRYDMNLVKDGDTWKIDRLNLVVGWVATDEMASLRADS